MIFLENSRELYYGFFKDMSIYHKKLPLFSG